MFSQIFAWWVMKSYKSIFLVMMDKAVRDDFAEEEPFLLWEFLLPKSLYPESCNAFTTLRAKKKAPILSCCAVTVFQITHKYCFCTMQNSTGNCDFIFIFLLENLNDFFRKLVITRPTCDKSLGFVDYIMWIGMRKFIFCCVGIMVGVHNYCQG